MNRSVGLPVKDQPDVRYGQWVARYFQSVLDAQGPTLSKVDAIITDPLNSQSKQHIYTRLTLPLKLEGGRALLCAPDVSAITDV